MERQNFENSWKKAFENAGVEPSANVWTNIELDLERARGSKLKRKLVFFQLLAAASVIFAMGVGVGVYVIGGRDLNPSNALSVSQPGGKVSGEPRSRTANDVRSGDQQQTISSAAKPHIEKNANKENKVDTFDNNQKVSSVEQYSSSEAYNLQLIEDNSYRSVAGARIPLPGLVKVQPITVVIKEEKAEVDPVALMMAKLAQREKELQEQDGEKKMNRSENLWTSVGVAAGSFSPINVASGGSADQSSRTFALNSSIAKQEAKASGMSYSVGANMGTRLSDRWIVQGGVNYLTQIADYTAHNAVMTDASPTSFRPASINELKKLNDEAIPSDEKVVSTAPYSVNNNLRYLSIPMQAGYMVVNRGFGLQLNAGVSTDLFLQNTVTAEGNNLDKSSSGNGSNSPYRSFNFSGLMGTELSYKFSSHYRVSLNPGVRYPFSSIYRSGVDVKATPLSFDLGLRFRYIFH